MSKPSDTPLTDAICSRRDEIGLAPWHDLEAHARLMERLLRLAHPVIERVALEGPAGNSVAEQIRDDIRAALTTKGRV